MRNPRRVLPHDVIYDRVWGYDFGPASNALRVYVGYLRRKLEQVGARPLSAPCTASATSCASHDPAPPHRRGRRARRGGHRARSPRRAVFVAVRAQLHGQIDDALRARAHELRQAADPSARRAGAPRDGDRARSRPAADRDDARFGGAGGLRAVRLRGRDGPAAGRRRRSALPRRPRGARDRARRAPGEALASIEVAGHAPSRAHARAALATRAPCRSRAR